MSVKKKIMVMIGCLWLSLCTACNSEPKEAAIAAEYNKFERTEEEFTCVIEDHTSLGIISTFNQSSIFSEVTNKVVDEHPCVIDSAKYLYDFQTGEKKVFSLSNQEILDDDLCICPNGNFLAYDHTEEQLKLYNGNFDLLAETMMEELAKSPKKTNLQIANVTECFADDHCIYVIGENNNGQDILYVLDEKLQFINVYKAKDEWKHCYGAQNEIYFFQGCNAKAQIFDMNKKDLVDQKYGFPGAEWEFECLQWVQGTDEYDYCYYVIDNQYRGAEENNSFLYGVKNGKRYKIFSLGTMGIGDKNIVAIVPDLKGGYYCFCSSSFLNEEQIYLFHYIPCTQTMDYSNQAGKEKIVIGCRTTVDKMNSYVTSYNALSDRYYIELISYQDVYDGDVEMAITHLFMDCMNGEVDGILLDHMEEENFIHNDLLLDLKEYIEQSEFINEEDLIDHYLESVTDEKGRIYALYPYYTIGGFFSSESIDFTDMEKYEDWITTDEKVFSYSDADWDLYRILVYSGNRYIDEEKEELHLQEKSFQSMLQLMKRQGGNKSIGGNPLIQYCSGEVKVIPKAISDPYDYKWLKLVFGDNMSIQNVGCEKALIYERNELLAINAKSEHKEGMYDFYDFIYQPSYYHSCYYFQYAPIFKSEWERWRKTLIATEEFTDDLGELNPVYNKSVMVPGAGIWEFSSSGMTEAEADELISTFQNAEYIRPMKDAYLNIIIEEAMEYMNGVISLEEACERMENRLYTAMEEQK